MYFTVADIRNDRAKQLAVMTAHELGERMSVGEESHVAFETAVVQVAKRANAQDTALVAAQLLNLDRDRRVKTIQVGMEQIVKIFGGDDAAMNYFRQSTSPKATVRFESVGGLRDDIISAKNRSALLAAKADQQRRLGVENGIDGYTRAERDYVDWLKSVRRTLDGAAQNGLVKPELAKTLINEIEQAAYRGTDAKPGYNVRVQNLQLVASDEYFDEARSKVLKQYVNILSNDPKDPSISGPSIH